MLDLGSEPFPYAPRVHYRNAPLFNVVCQLRFPTILRLETETPSAFQEAIRTKFPLVERMQPPILGQVPAEILQAIPMQSGWNFLSEDRSLVIGLGSDSMSLMVGSYDRWERFSELLYDALDALQSLYRPAFYSRIGLRYQDLITRSILGLSDEPWSSLFRAEILGELAIPSIEANLEDCRRVLRLRLPADDTSLLLQHGLVLRPGQDEPGYLTDFDFYTMKKTEVGDARHAIEKLHHWVGRAFRWCISDRLHAALDPVAL